VVLEVVPLVYVQEVEVLLQGLYGPNGFDQSLAQLEVSPHEDPGSVSQSFQLGEEVRCLEGLDEVGCGPQVEFLEVEVRYVQVVFQLVWLLRADAQAVYA